MVGHVSALDVRRAIRAAISEHGPAVGAGLVMRELGAALQAAGVTGDSIGATMVAAAERSAEKLGPVVVRALADWAKRKVGR